MKKPYIDSNKSDFLLDNKLTENQILKDFIKEKLHLSDAQIRQVVESKKEILAPVSIFRNRLSTLEILAKFLKENKNLTFSEIARLLNRDERTVWHAYRRSLRKKIILNIPKDYIFSKLHNEENIREEADSITIPISLFAARDYSPLETLVAYLKDSHQLKFNHIAALLDCSPKTVWTVYNRKQKKDATR